jgi:FG-GAP repeat
MKMRLELFELLPLEIRITMKMKNYTTQSNFALRTLCLTSGIAASLLFAATQSASAQTSSNRAGKTTQREQVKPDVRTEGKGTSTVRPLDIQEYEWKVRSQILSAIPSVVGDGFGSAVAMNEAGTILVVGASDAKVDNVNAVGAVHIYTYSDRLHAWEHVQLLECPQKITLGQLNGSPGLALFGWSVAISGSTIVVGAPVVTPNSGMPSLAGRVYVFQQSAKDQLWGKIFQGERVANKILGPTDPEMIGYFGGSVAIDFDPEFGVNDTRIAVGSTFRGTANQGGLYVFEGPSITPNLIVQKKFLLPDDVIAQDQFGSKVAMDGNLLVVGAQLADSDDLVNSGAAYVYRRTLDVGETIGTWIPEATFINNEGASEDGFGSSVSIVGNTIAVGAPGTDRGVVSAGLFVVGTSYTIKFPGTTHFTQIGASDNNIDTIFTATAEGSGTGTAYVASSSNGSAFVYRLTGGLWTPESEVFPRECRKCIWIFTGSGNERRSIDRWMPWIRNNLSDRDQCWCWICIHARARFMESSKDGPLVSNRIRK